MSAKPEFSRRKNEKALEIVQEMRLKIANQKLSEKELPNSETFAWFRKNANELEPFFKDSRYGGSSFSEGLKRLRERVARKFRKQPRRVPSDLEFWLKFLNELPLLEAELKRRISKDFSSDKVLRGFEKFNASFLEGELDRKKFVDAVSVCFDPATPERERLEFAEEDFSQNAKRLIRDFEAEASDFEFARNHEKLREEISKEIVLYSAKCAEELNAKSLKSEFFAEHAFLEKVEQLPHSEIADSIQTLKAEFLALKTAENANDIDFGFYENEFGKLKKRNGKLCEIAEIKGGKKPDSVWLQRQRERLENEIQAAAENFRDDLRASFGRRYEAWLKAELEKRNREFLKDLLERVEKFRQLEEMLSPILDEFAPIWKLSGENLNSLNSSYGYDLSRGFFQKSGFDLLRQYADLLQQDESIRELAELLGRHRREEVSYEIELRENVKIETEFRVAPAPKGQICGIETGNDISSVLPSELALYKHPATKDLFKLKFAQRQLLQYKYENVVQGEKAVTEFEEVQKAKREEKKGPILLCVDTSGSMQGTPEQFAKMLAFALTKIALKEDRKCFMISFSTEIATLDLTEFRQADGITKLLEFLQMSFHGGTDAGPALAHAVEKLKTEAWQDADVLMISDFQMGNLPQALIEEIKAAQKGGTKFHSLVIGSAGNETAIACFDNNWSYDPSDSKSQKRLVKQLRKLARNAENEGSEGDG